MTMDAPWVASIVSRHRVGRRIDVTSAPKVPHCSAGADDSLDVEVSSGEPCGEDAQV